MSAATPPDPFGLTELARRWTGCDDFTVVDADFGAGQRLLAMWAAWRTDPQRPQRLHIVALLQKPVGQAELQSTLVDDEQAQLAHQLVAAWPPAVKGLHRLTFEQGGLQVLLAFADLQRVLPELMGQADAFYINGDAAAPGSPCWDRRLIRALARRARPGATVAATGLSDAACNGFKAAGFERLMQTKDAIHCWRYVSHPNPRREPTPAPAHKGPLKAVVVGAGLAGASVAAALAQQGYAVTVLDRHAEPAMDSSGNPAGLFHATVHADDNPYARLFRAAALHLAALLRTLPPSHAVPHQLQGLLRLELVQDVNAMQALISRQALPPDFVQALAAEQASRLAGVPLPAPAWYYPSGGWLSPAAWVQQRLAQPGVRFVGGSQAHGLRRCGANWQVLGENGAVLASAAQLVLANAERSNDLLASIGWPPFPWLRSAGQVSLYQAAAPAPRLRVPVAGAGYALPLPDGWVLCGASTRPDSDDRATHIADHRLNFERLRALCGMQPPADVTRWQGRVGWRVQPADRLPVVGPLAACGVAGQRLDQARLVPREPGLHIACGFGARGITLAPLLAEVLAARITGSPVPVEQGLVDLVDPARWLVRAARRASA